MRDFFANGYRAAVRVSYLALFPFLVDLVFLTGRFVQSTSTYSFRVGLKFSLPFYFPSLTNVYDFPTQPGVSFQPLPEFGLFPIFGAASVVLYTVTFAYLSAGYLGSLHSSIAGATSSFVSMARKYFVRILAYTFFWLGLGLQGIIIVLIVPVFTIPYVFFLYFFVFFVLSYFLFLTPFVIVADDVPFIEALRRSIETSFSRPSRTLSYLTLYGLTTIVISALAYLILNIGLVGFVAALAGFAFVGTALVASTFYFFSNVTPSKTTEGASDEA